MDKVNDYDVDVVFPGGEPLLQIIDAYGNEMKKIPLSDKSVDEIIGILEENGFGKIK